MSKYLEIKITLAADFAEIIMAELSSMDFDSFSETETGINAYILSELFDESILKETQDKYADFIQFEYIIGELEDKNWNEEWEKNFHFTTVDKDVMIRASFHPADDSYPHEIIINPQMSFGTGHHDTTAGVIRHMLKMDFKDLSILDAGTGTGILAVMAEKLGAKYVYAYDIDEWPYHNCLDNFKQNNCKNIEIEQGDVSLIEKFGKDFDIVIANINKNVLLADIPFFVKTLKKNGYLVLSGFYGKDIEDMLECCNKEGLSLENQSVSSNEWAVLVLKLNK
jgi:ribosomal protein L11 methyltransferase